MPIGGLFTYELMGTEMSLLPHWMNEIPQALKWNLFRPLPTYFGSVRGGYKSSLTVEGRVILVPELPDLPLS
ncbi:hypothetical protein TNIN_89261 [Trichonephila inaurata madagascariensis]|uniref:Uncharacterized protein n=1 Tax=Trichonephila inaurata madagascariensis TaxID=2747483 RepID=A0A8X6YYB8_9ARAC|nr:hypothetical protein TNIN_89261 [Trichonephila inaurata madagascariensis]